MREYMDDKIALTGIVLIAAPIGESDKRLVLLTRERGKVTVFARGARRPGNPFLAAANTFAFGTFYVKEARTAYQLVQTEIRNYFREITEDVEAACYGSYFLEFADYYARENDDGTQIIQLLHSKIPLLSGEMESAASQLQYGPGRSAHAGQIGSSSTVKFPARFERPIQQPGHLLQRALAGQQLFDAVPIQFQ